MKNALSAASKGKPDVIILDAASMRTTGTRLCRRAREKLDGTPIILVSPEGSQPDPGCGASQTLVQPFTPRKLINRVDRLIPGDERETLKLGPIKLDKAKNRVYTKSGQSRLTPKLARLLEIFMNNPGRLMMRKTLIRKVWHTDYTGDTRTLDVHMSWLRQAIEEDPSNPELLKTIRGMGYRLDLPEA
jgi:DNA-binding response OmpR family regulator